jgi:hypothetical protein
MVSPSLVAAAPQPRWADEDLEAVDGQVAKVGVVAPLGLRFRGVLLGSHSSGECRVASVRPDHNAGPLDDGRAVVIVAADADHGAVIDQVVVDAETFAQLGSGAVGGVDEDLVENRSARRVSARDAVRRVRCPGDRDRAEVERVPGDWRRTRVDNRVEQLPAAQRRDGGRLHDVRGHGVARELGPVDHEDGAPAAVSTAP